VTTGGIPRVTARELLAALQRAGFSVVRSKGSHVRLRHPDGRAVTIPVHSGGLRVGTIAAILKAAQISPDELRRLI
jgi:predicted RNA binding protein YcfA (HicA-like mRNA interferase family)